MASTGQLELWHAKARERVEKYKALVKEETTKKKEFGRPKTPLQIKAKEDIVKLLQRYQDELDFAKSKEKEWDAQLKEARKEERESAPKSVKSVSMALSKKFSKTAVHIEAPKKVVVKTKAADNRIELPLSKKTSSSDADKVLQDLSKKVKTLEASLKSLEQRSNDRYVVQSQIIAELQVLVSKLTNPAS